MCLRDLVLLFGLSVSSAAFAEGELPLSQPPQGSIQPAGAPPAATADIPTTPPPAIAAPPPPETPLPEAAAPEPEKTSPPSDAAAPSSPPDAVSAEHRDANAAPSDDWRIFFKLGSSFRTHSQNNPTGNYNGYTVPYDDTGSAGGAVGIDLTYQPDFPLGISLVTEANQFQLQESRPGTDVEVAALLVPRLQLKFGGGTLWAGCGAGYLLTLIPLNTFTTIMPGAGGTYNVRLDGASGSFALSPRVGLDISLSQNVSLGLEGTYTVTKGSVGGQSTNMASAITENFVQYYTRSWYATSLRLGVRL